MTTPEEARDQLNRAKRLSSAAAGFNPVWTLYVTMCAGGAIYAMGSYYSGSGAGPVLWVSFAWIFAFMATMPVFNRYYPNARRGFGKRWVFMVFLWGITWAVTVWLPLSIGSATALALVFLALALGGSIWEATAGGSKK